MAHRAAPGTLDDLASIPKPLFGLLDLFKERDVVDVVIPRYLCRWRLHTVAPQIRQTVVLIPMKMIGDSEVIPVTHSDGKPITVGAKRRWRSYRA